MFVTNRQNTMLFFTKSLRILKKTFLEKSLINYLPLCDKRLLICNDCKWNFICSFKDFFVPFTLDEHLFILQRIRKEIWSLEELKD